MRKINTVITAVFIILAAALGWFLPVVVFKISDRVNEERQKDLDIQQINLSYRDDLAMSQKINIVHFEFGIADTIEIDKGIFVQREELSRIVGDFLADFTGYRFNLSKDMEAAPLLVNLSNNRGTIVVWYVYITLNDYWHFECIVDDKTGSILSCSFYGDPVYWESLIVGFNNAFNETDYVTEKFRNALYNHYSSRFNAKIVTYHPMDNYDAGDSTTYLFIFKDDRNYTFELSVTFDLTSGVITTY